MRARLIYGAAALPLGATVVASKLHDLLLGGFRVTALSSGLAGENAYSVWDRLAFFRSDLVVALIVLPLLAVVVAHLVRPKWRPLTVSALMILFTLLFYVQERLLISAGSFLNSRVILTAVRFAIERPEMLKSYVAVGGLVKIGGVMVITALLAWWSGRHDPDRGHRAFLQSAVSTRLALAVGVILLIATGAAWVPQRTGTPFHRSLLIRALTAYWADGDEGIAPPSTEPAQLSTLYTSLAGIARTPRDSTFWGRQAGSDVVFYVLETVPAQCLDLTGSLADLPAMDSLRRHAFVGTRHYATYPYSSYTNFSLFSSWYPSLNPESYIARHAGGDIRGVLSLLHERGYHTAFYEPYLAHFEPDSTMFRMLGVERHVAPGGNYGDRPNLGVIAAQDSAALKAAHADMEGWLAKGERYAVVFALQSSHGPWVDPVGGRTGLSLYERCRALVEMQDRWIAGLVGLIAQHGRVDKTVFVVMGDHGVRTAEEDPAFVPGILDDRSFHVPMMIYAPAAAGTTTPIGTVTSTIDISPTILDLMGIERDGSGEQGSAIWDPRLAGRTTYFFARSLFGANGYYQKGRFYSWNAVTGTVCTSEGSLRCADIVPAGALADSVKTKIRRMNGLQQAWNDAFVVESGGKR